MSGGDLSMLDSGNVQVIEWNMLNKNKFIPLSIASILTLRGAVYPLTVVKTRIQIQHKNEQYRGTLQTFRTIYVTEGWSGLYRGFMVNTCQVFASIFYLSTYEKARELLLTEFNLKNNSLRALIAGGCASASSQLILVPFDVVSQHMMVLQRTANSKRRDNNGTPIFYASRSDSLNLAAKLNKNPNLKLLPLVCQELYRKDGLIKGFYRGYLASLLVYAPSSAMFWGFYQLYCENIFALSPQRVPYLVVQAMAAPAAGATIAVLTNAMDLFRSNLQVYGESWEQTIKRLYHEEGWAVFVKGLSTRLVTIPLSSFLLIVGYEMIKRLSVRNELQHKIQW